MGRFKPLLPLGDSRTIERVVNMFKAAGITQIIVVVGHRAAEVRQAVTPLKVNCVENRNYRDGMFASVLAGVKAIPKSCRAFFIHPVDIPLVRFQTVKLLAGALEHARDSIRIVYPVFNGHRGHPTLIRTNLIPEIMQWPGTGGLRGLMRHHEDESNDFPVADEAVLMDLDTPDDYKRLQARLAHEGIPSQEECRVLMEEIQTLPLPAAAHCRAVSSVANCLVEALSTAGLHLNRKLVHTAALLHDLARAERNHAEEGASLLERHGFPLLSPLVAMHMDLEVNPGQTVDETQLVYLADKLVFGDQSVNLKKRFDRQLIRYGTDPEVAACIIGRHDNARRIQATVERITGRDLDEIVASAGLSQRLS
jgi:CTP:molybdopterin cytidylyltransferase MocA